MASPSNPFDEFDKPLAGRHSEGPAANPFDEFDEPDEETPPPAPVAQSPAARIANTDPYVQDLIAKGMNPERAALYASERGHPLAALKREIGEAGSSLKGAGSALVRPFVEAGESTLLPLDAAHSVESFIRAGDYTPEALRKSFVYGPVDPTLPSQQAQQTLDANTVVPQDALGKGAEMISSMLVGSKFPGMPATPKPVVPPTAADAVIAAGKQHNVPVYLDDVTKSAFAKKLGVGAENVPIVGTSAGRATQMEAAKKAAEQIADKYVGPLTDEVPPLIQQGLQQKLGEFRQQAGQLYQRAAGLLDAGGHVPTPKFNDAINAELQRQARLGTAANPKVVELLQKYKNAPAGEFSLMRELRSQLKGEISDFYQGGENKAIGEKGVERLTSLRDGLEDDMEDFAKSLGGDAYKSWKDADSFYKTNLVPFKQQGFADLVRTAEPEKAWRYLLAQGGIESRGERMYNALNESGRAAVRAGLVQDALQTASGPKGIFSPAKFAKYMEDNSTAVDKFFEGSDRNEINGFTNLMRHVERAGQHMENPPTGQRVIGALMLGSAAVSLKPLLIGAAAAGGTRVLFQTQRGRDLLLAASKLKPGSPAMDVLGHRIGRLMLSGSMTPYREGIEDQEQPGAVSQ